jgi:ATP-dependent DNA helicase PIF1
MEKYIDLLAELNIKVDFMDNLSIDQREALEKMINGENVILIGEAGCGKSHCIKEFVNYIRRDPNKNIYVTSTTGVSAYNLSNEYISGITINSYMGYGSALGDRESVLKRVVSNKVYRNRILQTDILIVDELSMMSADIFEKTDYILKKIRRSTQLFGGIQLVFSMDPYQLCPVFDRDAKDTRLVIESELFKKMKPNIIVLKKNFRQENDTTEFANVLSRIRTGDHTIKDISLLEQRKGLTHIEAIHVVSSNKKAKEINETQLNKLSGPTYEYKATYTANGINGEDLRKELENQFRQKEQDIILLKLGGRVMLTKNLDVTIGLVNGALGTIISFREEFDELVPVVKFHNGVKQVINKKNWELRIDGSIAKATQIPLILAWSFTSHKMQSLTVDKLEVDIGDAFTDGQCYTTLSRVKTLDGLFIKSFDAKKIKVNKKVKDFMSTL